MPPISMSVTLFLVQRQPWADYAEGASPPVGLGCGTQGLTLTDRVVPGPYLCCSPQAIRMSPPPSTTGRVREKLRSSPTPPGEDLPSSFVREGEPLEQWLEEFRSGRLGPGCCLVTVCMGPEPPLLRRAEGWPVSPQGICSFKDITEHSLRTPKRGSIFSVGGRV